MPQKTGLASVWGDEAQAGPFFSKRLLLSRKDEGQLVTMVLTVQEIDQIA